MWEAWIIEKLRRRELEQPQIQIPLPPPDYRPEPGPEPKSDRGVVIIDCYLALDTGLVCYRVNP